MNARCAQCERPLEDTEEVCAHHPEAGVVQELLYFDLNDPDDAARLMAMLSASD